MFRFNEEHIYTNYDLKAANILGLKCSLIKDGQANALLYQSNRQSGSRMLKNLVDYLFKLKKQEVPYAKEIINYLWGVL